MILARAAEAVMLLHGWRRAAFAVAAGAVGALALPPFGLWPLLVVPFSAAIWLIDGVVGRTRARRALAAGLDGWCWGFGYFVAGLWWLGSAFLVEAEKFLWALPFGVLGLPAVLALFPAAGFALAHSLWPRGPARALGLAGALGLAEVARGHLFTGFPWNGFGQALAENPYLAQGAALGGLYALTLAAIYVAAAPAAALSADRRRFSLPALAPAALLLLALAAHGWQRVPSAPVATVAGVKLRIMQPNLPQDDKFHPERAREIIERYIALSDQATSPRTLGVQDATHLFWPESAFPILIARTPAAMQRLMGFLPPHVTLVTGAARAGAALPGEANPPIFNSIHVITRAGGVVASYDKHHLVPFGEYLPGPFEALVRGVGLSQFVAIPGGFTPAPARRALAIPGLPPVAGSICYEAIFPGAVMPDAEGGERPRAIVNVTNDAWFGITPGPHQHLAQARLRAVEEGVPLVRAANNGVSAVVDPFGRVVASLPLGVDGVLDAGLPQALGPTTFSRIGNLPALEGMALCLLAAAVLRRRRARDA